jgi:hypothetical protein
MQTDYKISLLILFMEIIPVYSENHVKHLSNPCRHNADFLVLQQAVDTDTYIHTCIHFYIDRCEQLFRKQQHFEVCQQLHAVPVKFMWKVTTFIMHVSAY